MAPQTQPLMATSRMRMPTSALKHSSWMACGKGPRLKGLLLPHNHTAPQYPYFLPSCPTAPGDPLWSALKLSPVLSSFAVSCAAFLFASATREVLRVQLPCNICFYKPSPTAPKRALSHPHRWLSGPQWIFPLDLLSVWLPHTII